MAIRKFYYAVVMVALSLTLNLQHWWGYSVYYYKLYIYHTVFFTLQFVNTRVVIVHCSCS